MSAFDPQRTLLPHVMPFPCWLESLRCLVFFVMPRRLNMYLRPRLFRASLIVLLFPLATAAAPHPNAATRQACMDDAIKFCGSVIQDPYARRACMKTHKTELSAACKAALANQFGLPRTTPGTKPSCERFCLNRCMTPPAASSRTACLDKCMGRCSFK
jgi:hypothetical protein